MACGSVCKDRIVLRKASSILLNQLKSLIMCTFVSLSKRDSLKDMPREMFAMEKLPFAGAPLASHRSATVAIVATVIFGWCAAAVYVCVCDNVGKSRANDTQDWLHLFCSPCLHWLNVWESSVALFKKGQMQKKDKVAKGKIEKLGSTHGEQKTV